MDFRYRVSRRLNPSHERIEFLYLCFQEILVFFLEGGGVMRIIAFSGIKEGPLLFNKEILHHCKHPKSCGHVCSSGTLGGARFPPNISLKTPLKLFH